MKKLFLFFFVSFFAIYLITSPGNTPHDYFTRLGSSFLQGKYWLSENPPWLSELIPAGMGRFWVVYPPMPAILSIPFLITFGSNFPQQYLAHLLGAGGGALTMAIAYLIKKDKKLAVYIGLLTGVGTIVWFLSSVGSAWYLGQISAFFFLTLAILLALKKDNPLLIGMCLGAVYLSRPHVILSFPFFLFLMDRKNLLKNLVLISLGIAPFFIFDSLYNFVRFQFPLNRGYFLLPKILGEETAPWFIHGVANPVYIPTNLKVMFLSVPLFLPKFPYIQPSWWGLSIWITTPAFLFALKAPVKEKIVRLSIIAIIPIFLVVTSHGGTGFAQFGYRFAVDFYPFLMLLVILSIKKTGLKRIHWLILAVSVLVNLWGVLWINKFGWVSF